MKYELNHLNQPVGTKVEDWKVPPAPKRKAMVGHYCRLEPLDPKKHAESLFSANALDAQGKNWTYLPSGPFDTFSEYLRWLEATCCGNDPMFFAVIDTDSEQAVGIASYLRIKPASGSLEVGWINFSPLLQRTPAATEAIYLMMKQAFELGYRRFEWKCNALNAASRIAARRLGLSFEGIFRQAVIVKGRNRDTAWYAAIDLEWTAINEAISQWLKPSNFDEQGQQRTRLSVLTAPILNKNLTDDDC